MTLPPLAALRVFVVAARRLSFQDAAAELFVTPGAVSRQIRALEAHLGVPLFERRHRAVALTQMGALYLARCGPALDAVDAASRQVRALATAPPEPGSGLVRIDATPTFAMHWLIPRLAEFRALHPRIEVRLGTSQGPVTRTAEVDLHIRRDPAHFAGLHGVTFMSERSVLVGSPRLADPTSPAVPRIRMRSRPDLWPQWLAQDPAGAAPRFLDFDNTILAIQATVEGLGVGLIPLLFIEGLLQGGALRRLPESAPLTTGAYHLLRGDGGDSPATAAFRDWLLRTAER